MIDDAAICDLASRAGIASKWEDYAGEPHVVSIDSLKRILAALDLPCGTADELACSQQLLEALPEPTSEANKFRFSDVSTDVTLQAPSCHLLVPLARQQAIDLTDLFWIPSA